MQKTNPFCKQILKWLSKGKEPKHEADLFPTCKRTTLQTCHRFTSTNTLLLWYPKAWKYTVLVETNDKLGHQGAAQTYCLIKHQYYWKGMNRDIRKYIAQYALCCREKAKVQACPLQITEIPECPFNKIAMDLVPECETSSSGNKHILTIIDHLTGWPEAFPIPDKSADTIVSTFINQYLPVHMCPRYVLLDNDKKFQKLISWIKYFNN